MPTRVNIGNGYTAVFPDGMSKDDIKAALLKRHPVTGSEVAKADELPAQTVAESSPMAKQEVTPKPYDPMQAAYAGVQGVGRGAFNVGGIVGEATDPNYEADRAARAEEYPVESTLGYLGGAVAGGGAVGKVLGLVPGVAPVAGQTVRNMLRFIGQGAVAGGAQAGAEGEDIGTGAAAGAVAGPVAAGVAKAGIGAVRAVGGLLSPSVSNANAIRALAKRIKSTPQELQAAMLRFRSATGRAPTLTEITDAGSAEELGRIAEARISAADTFRGAEQRVTAQRPRDMARQIAAGGPTDNIARLTTVRKDAMDSAMGNIRNVIVRVPPREAERYLDPDVARVLNRDLRGRLAEAATNGTEARLTVKDIDDMRQAFGDAAGTGQRFVFNELADRISNIGARQVPAYGSALSEYKAFSRTIKGFENGSAAKAPTDLNNPLDIADSTTPEYHSGRNVGVRSRLTDEAGASERGAQTTANALRQNAGLADETRGALGARETERLQRLGAAETTGAERLSQASRAPRAPSQETEQSVKNAVERVAALGGHTLTGYKTAVFSRLITKAQLSSVTARKLAEAATDPASLPGVIDALRRAKLSEETIRSVLLPAVSRSAGAAAGGAQ